MRYRFTTGTYDNWAYGRNLFRLKTKKPIFWRIFVAFRNLEKTFSQNRG